jgi:hypothetical protein
MRIAKTVAADPNASTRQQYHGDGGMDCFCGKDIPFSELDRRLLWSSAERFIVASCILKQL